MYMVDFSNVFHRAIDFVPSLNTTRGYNAGYIVAKAFGQMVAKVCGHCLQKQTVCGDSVCQNAGLDVSSAFSVAYLLLFR